MALRVTGVGVVVLSVIYLPWIVSVRNQEAPVIAWAFIFAATVSAITLAITVANSWNWKTPIPRPHRVGNEPTVGILIPTCGEPIPMVLRTVESVLAQNWPRDAMIVVVSDDAHSSQLEAALRHYPDVHYHLPPSQNSPLRNGTAKSGNLNSAHAYLQGLDTRIDFIETRDADDECGSTNFLRLAVGQLVDDVTIAYVQTIKEAQVSPSDPFNNREVMFYRNQMLSRNAANAVFPCGSGLVWRREALDDIGGFPAWNLVEDLQSGLQALRRGWNSCFIPIVGAVGQHAPEDIPNVFKQRGTWATDALRLFLWKRQSGLNWRQRLQFVTLPLFYLNAFTYVIFVASVIATLFGHSPLWDEGWGALYVLAPYALVSEGWLLTANHPFNDRRVKQRHRIGDLWRVRVLWAGLIPVFIKATWLAVTGGPNRKPAYKVTRKTTASMWYWKETLPHLVIVATIGVGVVYAGVNNTLTNPTEWTLALLWGGLYLSFSAGFAWRGIHGTRAHRVVMSHLPKRWGPPPSTSGVGNVGAPSHLAEPAAVPLVPAA